MVLSIKYENNSRWASSNRMANDIMIQLNFIFFFNRSSCNHITNYFEIYILIRGNRALNYLFSSLCKKQINQFPAGYNLWCSFRSKVNMPRRSTEFEWLLLWLINLLHIFHYDICPNEDFNWVSSDTANGSDYFFFLYDIE